MLNTLNTNITNLTLDISAPNIDVNIYLS